MHQRPTSVDSQAGFTIIEVMVAMLVLIVGILGVLKMLDTANAQSIVTQSRSQANAIARQVTEAVRAVSYGNLSSPAAVETQLKAQPGLEDSNAADSIWTIVRRGTTYTVTIFALCTVDDGLDGYGVHTGAASLYCPDSSTTGTADSNPDDYKRVTIQLTWTDQNRITRTVRQTTLITNPGSGAGPGIYPNFKMETPACGTPPANQTTPPSNCRVVATNPETDTATFRVNTKDAAADVRWSLDNVPQGGATMSCAAGSSTCSDWSFVWSLGCLSQSDPAAVCFAPASAGGGRLPTTVDGNYLVGAYATDVTGNSGSPIYLSVVLNRRAPLPNPGFNVGWNGSIVEMEWIGNVDKDIQRYAVYRVVGTQDSSPGSGDDVLIDCGNGTGTAQSSTARTCTDTTATPGTSPAYWVVAYDNDDAGNLRAGTGVTAVSADPTNTPPNPPTNFKCSTCTGSPITFTWTGSSDTNPGGTVAFYRIYRRNTAGIPTIADRYDRTTTASPTTYTDADTGTPHYYWITAVDNNLAESTKVALTSTTAGG
jgi:type IV pilus modification protein PilV